MSWVLVLICNEPYLPKTIQTISECRDTGCWKNDIVLLVPAAIQHKTDLLESAGRLQFTVRLLPERNLDVVKTAWEAKPGHLNYQYNTTRYFQHMKYYVMDTWFKKWNYVFYIDAGMNILKPMQRIIDAISNRLDGCIFAHDETIHMEPYHKFLKQYSLDAMTVEQREDFLRNYNYTGPYFQSTTMLYDTSIIQDDTVEILFGLMERFPTSSYGDQGNFNLHFTIDLGIWRALPLRDAIGLLYYYCPRVGFVAEDYVMVKCPNIHWP
jgi:hypothetical protein